MLAITYSCQSGKLPTLKNIKIYPKPKNTTFKKVHFTYFISWKDPTLRKKNLFDLDFQRNIKDSHILGRKHRMQEVCSQTQWRYICHERDVIRRVCNNIWKLLEYGTCLTGNSSASSICHLQQIGSNSMLSSFRQLHYPPCTFPSRHTQQNTHSSHPSTNQHQL
jgi:hypothetical protein